MQEVFGMFTESADIQEDSGRNAVAIAFVCVLSRRRFKYLKEEVTLFVWHQHHQHLLCSPRNGSMPVSAQQLVPGAALVSGQRNT